MDRNAEEDPRSLEQNAITALTDRLATVRTILRGNSLTSFETAVDEVKTVVADDGSTSMVALTVVHVEVALAEVAKEVFPHRALDIQRAWMRRGIHKPGHMNFRRLASAVIRINNALPLFPGGTDEHKLSEQEVLEILEWSLPNK